MKDRFWNKRIPTFLGVILIAIGLGVTTFLVKQGGLFSINASPSTQPENVRITNVTDTAFTISYQTSDAAFGVISYGNTPSLGQSGLDDRDQNSGNVTAHKIHNITVRNLSPDTKYYFSIISGKDTFLNNSAPYEITTGTQISQTPSNQDPVSGKIILPVGKAPTEGIIYLTADGSQVISTLVKDDGTFLLPLNSMRNSDFANFFGFSDTTILKLLAIGDGQSSNVVLSILQIKPVPTITLSSDYDFTTSTTKTASSSASTGNFPSFSSSQQDSSGKGNPQILTPQKDQNFSDQQPEFKGTAPANETIDIVIHSDEQIKTTVKADSNGNWSYRPTSTLTPGNHTVTIVAKDVTGVVKTITQSFVVYASGSQVNGENGSPTPTPILTNTPTPTLTTSPTPTTTTDNNTQQEVTTTVSPTPTTIVQSSVTPSPPLPPTGNPSIITFGIVGLAITFIGGLLFLISRGILI